MTFHTFHRANDNLYGKKFNRIIQVCTYEHNQVIDVVYIKRLLLMLV